MQTADTVLSASATARHFRRRQLVRLLVVSLIGFTVSTVVLVNIYDQMLSVWLEQDLPVYFLPEQMNEIMSAYPTLSSILEKWVWIALGTNLALLVFAGGFITYRLATPLYRVNRAILDIGQGKLYTDIELGAGDDFQVLADSLNDAVAKIQLMIMTLEENLAELEHLDPTDKEHYDTVLRNTRSALDYFETIDLAITYKDHDQA